MEGHDAAGKVAATKTGNGQSSGESGGGGGGVSPTLTDGDRSSNSSSPPSGTDQPSDAVEDGTTSPTGGDAVKPTPRKVTNPEEGISSYQALEEGLQTLTDMKAPRAKTSPPMVVTTSGKKSASTSSKSTKSKKSSLRRGKWTVEEEAYVARVIRDFNYGYLNAPAGTTLRTYLSEKLKCDPMRITKKFTGDACIGKRVFHPAVRSADNAAALDQAQVSAPERSKSFGRVYLLCLTRHVSLPIPSVG